jgi:hypothetical protein
VKPLITAGDAVHLVQDLAPKLNLLLGQRADEVLVELAAVGADEHHLSVERGEGG